MVKKGSPWRLHKDFLKDHFKKERKELIVLEKQSIARKAFLNKRATREGFKCLKLDRE